MVGPNLYFIRLRANRGSVEVTGRINHHLDAEGVEDRAIRTAIQRDLMSRLQQIEYWQEMYSNTSCVEIPVDALDQAEENHSTTGHIDRIREVRLHQVFSSTDRSLLRYDQSSYRALTSLRWVSC